MKTNHDEAFAELARIFLRFEGRLPLNQKNQWLDVESYVGKIAEEGWTRKDIFNLIKELHGDLSISKSAACLEAVGEYLDLLLGWVSPSCIVRLPGEPCTETTLTAYVRGNEWLKSTGP